MTSNQIYRDIGGKPVLYIGDDEHDPARVVLRFMGDEIVMPRAEWERLPLWSGTNPFPTGGRDHA